MFEVMVHPGLKPSPSHHCRAGTPLLPVSHLHHSKNESIRHHWKPNTIQRVLPSLSPARRAQQGDNVIAIIKEGRETVPPPKVKRGPGSGNAKTPWSPAPRVCRLEEGTRNLLLRHRAWFLDPGSYWPFSPHPDARLEPREKLLFHEQGSRPHWSYPRLLGAQLDSPSGRCEKARATAGEVRGQPEADLGV